MICRGGEAQCGVIIVYRAVNVHCCSVATSSSSTGTHTLHALVLVVKPHKVIAVCDTKVTL
jgi:hypothetical protein